MWHISQQVYGILVKSSYTSLNRFQCLGMLQLTFWKCYENNLTHYENIFLKKKTKKNAMQSMT